MKNERSVESLRARLRRERPQATISARKLRNIRLENEEIVEYNARASAQNYDVDQAVNTANKKVYDKFQADNRGRGRVKVTTE